jgi:hypothetical protein
MNYMFETADAKVSIMASASTDGDGYLFNVEHRNLAVSYVQAYDLLEIINANPVLKGNPTMFNELLKTRPKLSFEHDRALLTWDWNTGRDIHKITLAILENAYEGQSIEVAKLTRANNLIIAKVDALATEVRRACDEITQLRAEMKIYQSTTRWPFRVPRNIPMIKYSTIVNTLRRVTDDRHFVSKLYVAISVVGMLKMVWQKKINRL